MTLIRVITLLTVLSFSAVVYGGEIYKWKDKDGHTHFSDPASTSKAQIQNSEKVKLIGSTVTDDQRNQAEAIAAKMKIHEDRSPINSPVAPVDILQTNQDTPPAADPKSQCREEWRKYKASQDCFAPYVTVNGVKSEAYQHCTELRQPTKFCN